jgi:hypothetical protein
MAHFPLSPTLNQQVKFGNTTWVWNGIGWVRLIAKTSIDANTQLGNSNVI